MSPSIQGARVMITCGPKRGEVGTVHAKLVGGLYKIKLDRSWGKGGLLRHWNVQRHEFEMLDEGGEIAG